MAWMRLGSRGAGVAAIAIALAACNNNFGDDKFQDGDGDGEPTEGELELGGRHRGGLESDRTRRKQHERRRLRRRWTQARRDAARRWPQPVRLRVQLHLDLERGREPRLEDQRAHARGGSPLHHAARGGGQSVADVGEPLGRRCDRESSRWHRQVLGRGVGLRRVQRHARDPDLAGTQRRAGVGRRGVSRLVHRVPRHHQPAPGRVDARRRDPRDVRLRRRAVVDGRERHTGSPRLRRSGRRDRVPARRRRRVDRRRDPCRRFPGRPAGGVRRRGRFRGQPVLHADGRDHPGRQARAGREGHARRDTVGPRGRASPPTASRSTTTTRCGSPACSEPGPRASIPTPPCGIRWRAS